MDKTRKERINEIVSGDQTEIVVDTTLAPTKTDLVNQALATKMARHAGMDKILLFFAIKYHGDWDKVYDALEVKEKVNPDSVDKVLAEVLNHVDFITILDPRYPNNLRMSYRPPFVLFYQGNIKLLLAYYKTLGVITNSQEVADMQKVEKVIASNRFIMLSEDNYAHECEHTHVYISLTPIKNKYTKKEYSNDNTLYVSEFYDKSAYDTESDRGFLLRLFSGLTNNNIVYATNYELAFDQVIAYMQNNGNNVFALETSNENTTKKLIRRGTVVVDNIDTIMDTI